jgi:hypothetical protein
MTAKSFFALVTLFGFAVAASAASVPVTGWSIGLNNAGSVALLDAETSSPKLGDGTPEDADNTAMHAAFPSITLGLGDTLTLSGSVQVLTTVGATPSALAAEFRWGLFNENGSSGLTNWLGYYATDPSGTTTAGVRRKNPSTAAYYSATGTTLLYANSLVDTSFTFADGTYAFSLSLERTQAGIELLATLDNGQGYAMVPLLFEDAGANTFTFNRVGFLSGNGLNADQLAFSNIEVTLTPVPEPSVAAFLVLGALGIFGRFRRC